MSFWMMSALRLRKQLLQRFTNFKCLSTAAPQEDEYTATPQYPPILDLSHKAVAARRKEAQHETIKAVKTVEEKQIKLNMPRYYGFKCYMLQEDYVPYNNLNLIQHVTKTHIIRNQNLPNFYNEIDVGSLIAVMKNDLEQALLMELEKFRQTNDLRKNELSKTDTDNLLSSIMSKQINRLAVNHMSNSHPHLRNSQIDFDSRIESFWFAGGMNPPEHIKRCKRGQEWRKDEVDDPVDRGMNYVGSSTVSLRARNPLRPILSLNESENPDLTVPYFELDPRTVGTKTEFRHIANIPGWWPGDPNRFGLLSYHQRGHLLTRTYRDDAEQKEAVDRQGILSSFGWLNAQANLLGFTTFNDITYPLVTQTVITNGQLFSFYVYQLNTILINLKLVKENPQRNVCWATPELKLFEEVVDGKFVGFNDEVLGNLLKFYANVPEERLGVNMTPYLSQEEKVCADYEDDDKRQWLEKEYKYLVANRPRHIPDYEIYAWEKIYKIDNQTRFMDKKRRPFEFKVKPWDRKLNDRLPKYIPRALRPNLPRWKGRYAKEYFP